MWLRLRGLSRPEDDFEAWVAQRHQERVLDGDATPAAPCPDEAFLKELAKKSKRIALGDPRVGHAANCPICMRRLLALRREHHSRRLRLVFTAAVASCLLIAALFVDLTRHRASPQLQVADLARRLFTRNDLESTRIARLLSELRNSNLEVAREERKLLKQTRCYPGPNMTARSRGLSLRRDRAESSVITARAVPIRRRLGDLRPRHRRRPPAPRFRGRPRFR